MFSIFKKNKDKIIIVPDIHGRSFWRKVLDNKKDRIVFLGDYSDPYPHEEFTHEDALRELANIIEFKKSNPERVILLWGNHDVHYLNHRWACWRFSLDHYKQYRLLYTSNYSLFQIAYETDMQGRHYLFTHAGVSKDWLMRYAQHIVQKDSIAERLNETWEQNPDIFKTVGEYRGGTGIGSPIWADVREHDFGGIKGVTQIFGHSQQQTNPILAEQMNCVDCRRVFVLENGGIKEYSQ